MFLEKQMLAQMLRIKFKTFGASTIDTEMSYGEFVTILWKSVTEDLGISEDQIFENYQIIPALVTTKLSKEDAAKVTGTIFPRLRITVGPEKLYVVTRLENENNHPPPITLLGIRKSKEEDFRNEDIPQRVKSARL